VAERKDESLPQKGTDAGERGLDEVAARIVCDRNGVDQLVPSGSRQRSVP